MRIKRIQDSLSRHGLEGYLVTNIQNIYYVTGFLDIPNPYFALFIPLDSDPTLFTPPLSYAAAQKHVQNCVIQKVSQQDLVPKLLAEMRSIPVIGFDDLSISLYLDLESKLSSPRFSLHRDIVWALAS